MYKWLVLAALLLGACAGTSAGVPATRPPAVQPPSAPRPVDEGWLTKLDRDHALVGKIWDVEAAAFVDAGVLVEKLARARFVLLGERHDNPDHHRLQARIVEKLVQAGRRPAVVLEMLDVSQQSLVDQYRARPDASAAGFGAALAWERTSWPPFAEYQPIFVVAFAHKLPIFAGNLPNADAKALVKQGLGALSAERVAQLGLAAPFPAPLETALLDELRASHCGQLPETLLAPMALAQHARDAQMAKVLATAAVSDSAVLIAGGGHARLDRGVPYYLASLMPGATVANVVFREVRHGDAQPQQYAAEEGPFDFVWFTPRGSDEDPCAAFHGPSK
jgi:uncharacterized iron-regulated protein